MPPDSCARTFQSEAMASDSTTIDRIHCLITSDPNSIVSYSLQSQESPGRLAEQLTCCRKRVDPEVLVGKILTELSPILFEPYGIHDSEVYLCNAEDPQIVTERWTEPDRGANRRLLPMRNGTAALQDHSTLRNEVWSRSRCSQMETEIDGTVADSFGIAETASGKLICGNQSKMSVVISLPEQRCRKN